MCEEYKFIDMGKLESSKRGMSGADAAEDALLRLAKTLGRTIEELRAAGQLPDKEKSDNDQPTNQDS